MMVGISDFHLIVLILYLGIADSLLIMPHLYLLDILYYATNIENSSLHFIVSPTSPTIKCS